MRSMIQRVSEKNRKPTEQNYIFKVEKILKGNLDPITFSKNSNYERETLLEV